MADINQIVVGFVRVFVCGMRTNAKYDPERNSVSKDGVTESHNGVTHHSFLLPSEDNDDADELASLIIMDMIKVIPLNVPVTFTLDASTDDPYLLNMSVFRELN